MSYKILVIGAIDNNWFETVELVFKSLEKTDFQIYHQSKPYDIVKSDYDLVIVDSQEAYDITELIAFILKDFAKCKVIVVTSAPTWMRAREVFKAGAFDYIHKTYNTGTLSRIFTRAINFK